jgi:hypothetical protein
MVMRRRTSADRRTLLEIATGTPKPTRARARELESIEQRAFVQRWRMHPDTKHLPACAIPNGGGRSKAQAGILKAEGVEKGPPDWICFEPMTKELPDGSVRHFKGIVLEFKDPEGKNDCTPDQLRWHAMLRERGWWVDVPRTSEAAWRAVRTYLELKR